MTTTIMRGVAWVAACAVLLPAGLYVLLVAINWNDRPPSPQAQRLSRTIHERPHVSDEANAYTLALGINVPRDADPMAWGRARKAFLEALSPDSPESASTDFPGPEVNLAATRTPATLALMKACHRGDAVCLGHLDSEAAQHWLESESWLLDRYLTLTTRTQWKETIPADIRAPFAPYRPLLDGQQLLLTKAWWHARRAETGPALELLQRDLVFWRTVLRSSDLLITKMIATTAVDRHFQAGNLVLRELHLAGVSVAPPAAWWGPVSREERSLERTLAGEWCYAAAALAATTPPSWEPEPTALGRATDKALRPLLKRQATMNLSAERMARLAASLDVDLADLPDALATITPRTDGLTLRFYNPVGRILDSVASETAYLPYAARLGDLEGTRRTALAVTSMREDRTKEPLQYLRHSPFRNPYTEAPLAWDEQQRSVVFTGVAQGERGMHALLL